MSFLKKITFIDFRYVRLSNVNVEWENECLNIKHSFCCPSTLHSSAWDSSTLLLPPHSNAHAKSYVGDTFENSLDLKSIQTMLGGNRKCQHGDCEEYILLLWVNLKNNHTLTHRICCIVDVIDRATSNLSYVCAYICWFYVLNKMYE